MKHWREPTTYFHKVKGFRDNERKSNEKDHRELGERELPRSRPGSKSWDFPDFITGKGFFEPDRLPGSSRSPSSQ